MTDPTRHAAYHPLRLDPRILLAAFHHALRAQTAIVDVVADALIEYRGELEADWRHRIVQDIDVAMARGEAHERWLDVAEQLR